MLKSQKFLGGAAIVVIVSLLSWALLVWQPSVVREFENRSWDWRARIVADKSAADPRIKLIVIDQASLDFLEREYALTWPIPRDIYKYVISFLNRGQAHGLAFDLLFTESSAQAVEADKEFAQATGAGPLKVISSLSLERYSKFVSPEKLEKFRERQTKHSESGRWRQRFFGSRELPVGGSVTLPIIELIENSSGLGSVSGAPDSDGVYRHYALWGSFEEIPILSLPLALYAESAQDATGYNDSGIDSRGIIVPRIFGGTGTYQTYSLATVLQAEAAIADGKSSELVPGIFKDSWVILGGTAPGLLDLRPTSLENRGNGMEIIAAVFDNLLHGSFIRQPSLFAVAVCSFLGILLFTAAALQRGHLSRHFASLAILVVILICFFIFAAKLGWWLPFVVPFCGMIAAAFLGFGLQYQLEGRQHQFIRKAFQYYVSPDVVEQMVSQPKLLSVGGERRELTMFFSDIVGFTSISERLQPGVLATMINEYLSLVSDIIQDAHGTVDKYVGDSVVAFWNAPLAVADHALRALQAAIVCQEELLSRAESFTEEYGVQLATRIGIHTDMVNVGNFGSQNRFAYTMIGDGANLASRLEGANKKFGTFILFSENVRTLIEGQVVYRRVGALRVIGRHEPVSVFEPRFSLNQSAFSELSLSSYNRGLAAFEKGDLREARDHFAETDHDAVAQAYLERIDQVIKSTDQKWTPVWELTGK